MSKQALLTVLLGGGLPEVGRHPLDPPEEGDDEDLVLGRRAQVGQRVGAGHTPGDGDNVEHAAVLLGRGVGEVPDLDVVPVQGDAYLGHDLWT